MPLELKIGLGVLAVVVVIGVIVLICKSVRAKRNKAVQVKEENIEKIEEVVSEVAVCDAQEEVLTDNSDSKKRIPFANKMLELDEKTQEYYNVIMNKFKSLRKINIRVSSKGVSYRLGRELVAKLTVRGKTMKLHLALDVNAFDEKVYFQKDMSDVKSYVEVPFAVKVKSDRGLKNALKLIDALIENKGIEGKTRFNEANGVEDLKALATKK